MKPIDELYDNIEFLIENLSNSDYCILINDILKIEPHEINDMSHIHEDRIIALAGATHYIIKHKLNDGDE